MVSAAPILSPALVFLGHTHWLLCDVNLALDAGEFPPWNVFLSKVVSTSLLKTDRATFWHPHKAPTL